MKKERNSNIELIKLVALVLIIISSALPYGAIIRGGGENSVYVDLIHTEFSITHILFSLGRWCGQIGDTLFIVVSAYFLSDSNKIKIKKTIRMVIDTWLISMLGLIISVCFMTPTKMEIFKSFFPIRYELNWFVGCYK